MPDLEVELVGVKLRSPVILSSGPMGRSGSLIKRIAERTKVGAITTRCIGITGHEGHMLKKNTRRYVNTPLGILSTDGPSDTSLEKWTQGIKEAKKTGIPIIASINIKKEDPVDEVIELTTKLEEAGADFIEVAPSSCAVPVRRVHQGVEDPNWKATVPSAEMGEHQNLDRAALILKTAKKAANIPVILKTRPEPPNLLKLVKVAGESGADAIHIRDTLFCVMRFDIDSGRPLIVPVASTYWLDISGSMIKPIAVGDVMEARRHTDMPIIGTGGVSNWQDAIEMIMAGATVVGLQTAALIEGPYVINRIVAGIENYLESKGYESIDEFRGLGIKKIDEEQKTPRKYSVQLEEILCDGCGKCEMSCIYDAIAMKNEKPVIDYKICTNCCLCSIVCPTNAIKVVEK